MQLPCTLQCVTLQLPDGERAEFCGLCNHWVSLTKEDAETIPYEMPEGKTMLDGLTVVLMDPDKKCVKCPACGLHPQTGIPAGQ